MVDRNLYFEDAKLIWRNFSGREVPPYNAEGSRNFCIRLDEETANELKAEGWNIREKVSKYDPNDVIFTLQVHVRYGKYPPKIVLVTSKNRTVLTEDNISQLDWAEIIKAKVAISPYNYDFAGKKGTKAMLSTLYVEIEEEEDPFEKDYVDIPLSGSIDEELPF